MADAEDAHEEHAKAILLERMLFFSDAVFAIVLTLLAIDLRMPAEFDDAHLFEGLNHMRGELIAFAVSFGVVAVFWIAHLTLMRALAAFDWVVAAVNLAFLFTITITPFVTTLVGVDGNLGNGWRLYCAAIVAIGLAQGALLLVSHRDEPRLIRPQHHGRLDVRLVRATSPGIAFAVGLALSLAGFHALSSLCWVLVPVIIIAARLLDDPKPRGKAAPADQP